MMTQAIAREQAGLMGATHVAIEYVPMISVHGLPMLPLCEHYFNAEGLAIGMWHYDTLCPVHVYAPPVTWTDEEKTQVKLRPLTT
jgi:hypothetical protein